MSDTERLAKIEKTLERIERCVIGDAEFGQLGIVARVNNLAGRIKSLERVVYYWGGAIAGAAAVIGLIYKLATDWAR